MPPTRPNDGWGAAADWTGDAAALPEPPPAPNTPTAPLATQGSRRLVQVVCCPACQSPLVSRDGARRAGDALAYWSCRECPATWKEAANVGLGVRAYMT